jgi:uncharacterized protein (DUF305 family)
MENLMRKISALAALTLGLSLTLTACGSDDADTNTSSSVSSTEHNDADVAFASDMIQHHAQALAMVDLTTGRELDPEVQALAEDIHSAQVPEVELMAGWLREWGEDIPETVMDHANAGHYMEGMDSDVPGIMSGDEMKTLENASDTEFQDMWLEMMVEHHEGAIEMARTEMSEGQYKDAVNLADRIATSQAEEIESMEGLLSDRAASN